MPCTPYRRGPNWGDNSVGPDTNWRAAGSLTTVADPVVAVRHSASEIHRPARPVILPRHNSARRGHSSVGSTPVSRRPRSGAGRHPSVLARLVIVNYRGVLNAGAGAFLERGAFPLAVRQHRRSRPIPGGRWSGSRLVRAVSGRGPLQSQGWRGPDGSGCGSGGRSRILGGARAAVEEPSSPRSGGPLLSWVRRTRSISWSIRPGGWTCRYPATSSAGDASTAQPIQAAPEGPRSPIAVGVVRCARVAGSDDDPDAS
jgi:hypothetical protein